MKYYSFDQFTSAYIGFAEADESPEENGVFLLPAWATWEEPPVAEEGSTNFFVEGKWQSLAMTPGEALGVQAGIVLTDDQKRIAISSHAHAHVEAMSKALGFISPTDLLSYEGEDSQRGRDAEAFRAWRAIIMASLDEMINKQLGNTDPLPSPQVISSTFEAIRLERFAPVKEKEAPLDRSTYIDPLLEEAREVSTNL